MFSVFWQHHIFFTKFSFLSLAFGRWRNEDAHENAKAFTQVQTKDKTWHTTSTKVSPVCVVAGELFGAEQRTKCPFSILEVLHHR